MEPVTSTIISLAFSVIFTHLTAGKTGKYSVSGRLRRTTFDKWVRESATAMVLGILLKRDSV